MRVALIGPAPPPNGGMAMQTQQLLRLLNESGIEVEHIVTNRDYRPKFVGKIPIVRAIFRLFGYLWHLFANIKTFNVIHLMANSGWSFYLFAMPVIYVARQYNVPVIMNYRGGLADEFFAKHWRWIKGAMHHVDKVVVPSEFLKQVFEKYDIASVIVPNIVDLALFDFHVPALESDKVHVVVTRNLEEIYDVATAIDGFCLFQQQYPCAQLSIAGSGDQLSMLSAKVASLNLNDNIRFVGRLEREQIANLYQQADILLNTSLVDNTPNSIIEALACGLVVVSSNVGGIPHLLTHQQHGYLCQPRCAASVARYLSQAVEQPCESQRLALQGHQMVAKFSPEHVVPTLINLYRESAIYA